MEDWLLSGRTRGSCFIALRALCYTTPCCCPLSPMSLMLPSVLLRTVKTQKTRAGYYSRSYLDTAVSSLTNHSSYSLTHHCGRVGITPSEILA